MMVNTHFGRSNLHTLPHNQNQFSYKRTVGGKNAPAEVNFGYVVRFFIILSNIDVELVVLGKEFSSMIFIWG
jgi:hypothetical protein